MFFLSLTFSQFLLKLHLSSEWLSLLHLVLCSQALLPTLALFPWPWWVASQSEFEEGRLRLMGS